VFEVPNWMEVLDTSPPHAHAISGLDTKFTSSQLSMLPFQVGKTGAPGGTGAMYI